VLAAIRELDRRDAQSRSGSTVDVVRARVGQAAVLIWFPRPRSRDHGVGPFEYVDRLPLKRDFRAAGVRVVPGAGPFRELPRQRRGGLHAVRSQIRCLCRRRHDGRHFGNRLLLRAESASVFSLAGFVGMVSILEPPQAKPVVIEDDVFHRSRCPMICRRCAGANCASLGPA